MSLHSAFKKQLLEKWQALATKTLSGGKRERAKGAGRYKLRYILKSLYQASGEVVNDFSDAFVLDWIIYTQNERELYEMDFLTSSWKPRDEPLAFPAQRF